MTHNQPLRADWQVAHEALATFAKARAHLDWEEGTLLLRAFRSRAHVHLGFGSFGEYVERLLGYKPRWTAERLRVAESLENLPAIEQSLRDGKISWSAARELTRVAAAETEHDWLEAAHRRSVREIEELVAGHAPGDRQDDPHDWSRERHILRFEISAETMAHFRDAMAKVRRDAGEPLDDDAALLAVARCILGGPKDVGRSNYQLAMTICEACGRGWQKGSGIDIEVRAEVVEMARCDAQHLGTHVGRDRARQDIPPRVRRDVMRRDGGRCVVPGCRNAIFLDLHHLNLRSEGGNHDPDGLVVLCGAHHRAQHRGQLLIEGRVSTGLVFRHSDGSPYGDIQDSRVAGAHEEAFRLLRALGFRERESRTALERVRMAAHPNNTSTDVVLRGALAVLT